jgi:hypothetical protein
MSALGFTFYPKDWWTSDSFFEFDARERYVYLELIFLMYQNDGYVILDREQVGQRLRMDIPLSVWSKITQKLTKTDLGYTHHSVKKRNAKAVTSRENGKKGGRPPKPNNPPVNPPLESKGKGKEKVNKKIEPPSEKEFMVYIKSKITEQQYEKIRGGLILRYQSWIVNDWKDGFGTPIKNWKNKGFNACIQLLKK